MTNLTGYETFCLYLALKNHFTRNSYDFFKYHGKTHATKESFINRRDRFQFQRLSRKYNADQMKDFLVANFLHDDRIWVGQLLEEDAEDRYNEYVKRNQSLTYSFKNDLDKIGNLKQAVQSKNGNHSTIVMLLMSGTISYHTFVIIDSLADIISKFDTRWSDDFIWSKLSLKLKKFAPFIVSDIDKKKFGQILKEHLANAIYS